MNTSFLFLILLVFLYFSFSLSYSWGRYYQKHNDTGSTNLAQNTDKINKTNVLIKNSRSRYSRYYWSRKNYNSNYNSWNKYKQYMSTSRPNPYSRYDWFRKNSNYNFSYNSWNKYNYLMSTSRPNPWKDNWKLNRNRETRNYGYDHHHCHYHHGPYNRSYYPYRGNHGPYPYHRDHGHYPHHHDHGHYPHHHDHGHYPHHHDHGHYPHHCDHRYHHHRDNERYHDIDMIEDHIYNNYGFRNHHETNCYNLRKLWYNIFWISIFITLITFGISLFYIASRKRNEIKGFCHNGRKCMKRRTNSELKLLENNVYSKPPIDEKEKIVYNV